MPGRRGQEICHVITSFCEFILTLPQDDHPYQEPQGSTAQKCVNTPCLDVPVDLQHFQMRPQICVPNN